MNVTSKAARLQLANQIVYIDIVEVRGKNSALSYPCRNSEPISEIIVPFDAALKTIVPSDKNIKQLFWNTALYQFNKQPRMNKPVEGFRRVKEGTVNSASIFGVVID